MSKTDKKSDSLSDEDDEQDKYKDLRPMTSRSTKFLRQLSSLVADDIQHGSD